MSCGNARTRPNVIGACHWKGEYKLSGKWMPRLRIHGRSMLMRA